MSSIIRDVVSHLSNPLSSSNTNDNQNAGANNTPLRSSHSQAGTGMAEKNLECDLSTHPSLTHLTKNSGAPIADDQHSLIVQPGYLMMQDHQLFEKLAAFNRERIPERVVHARGAGAHGHFELTHDMSQYTKASLFNGAGKRTPVFARFSAVRGAKESTEGNRDPRGFSLKHYTDQGVYDMVGNNTPVFFVRDPSLFVDLIHAFKPNPRTNLPNYDAVWDFCSLVPESLHQILILMSPRGIPQGYRFMQGYSSHTFKWVNAAGEFVWVKYHYKTQQGVKNYTQKEADELQDPNFATRDLFDSIAAGQAAVWDMYVQLIPDVDVSKLAYDIFDITKVVPHADYPLQPVGKLVLNKNPTNYFAEVEQAAFAPSNLVPGIETSPDRILQSRLFAYTDAANYRLGVNHPMIPINRPTVPVHNQGVDGLLNSTPNGGAGPNYYPNSLVRCPFMSGGNLSSQLESQFSVHGVVGRHGYAVENVNSSSKSRGGREKEVNSDADYVQPRNFWLHVLNEKEKDQTIDAIATAMVGIRKEVQERVVTWMAKADEGLAKRIQMKLQETKMTDQPLH